MASRISLADPATETSSAGVEGNARLTASAAVVLLALLAAEGATLPAIHQLLRPHVFIGFALIPPVALKIGSTLYRFVRYYSGHQAYRRKGPPHPVLRILGPVVILTTVALLGTGVALGVLSGSAQRNMLFWHKASFVLWFAAMTLHVLGHIAETARLGPRDWWPERAASRAAVASPAAPSGGAGRRWSLAASVAAGALLGVWGLSQLGPWLGISH